MYDIILGLLVKREWRVYSLYEYVSKALSSPSGARSNERVEGREHVRAEIADCTSIT